MQRLLLALERPLRFNYVTTSQLKVSKWLQLKLWNSGFLAILLHALFKVHYVAILWPGVGPLRTRSGPSGSTTDLNGPQTGLPPELSKRTPPDPIRTPTDSASDFKVQSDPVRVWNRSDKVHARALNESAKFQNESLRRTYFQLR